MTVATTLRRGVTLSRALLNELRWRMTASPEEKRHRLVGPLHLWQSKRNAQIRFLQSQGLQPSDFLLDIGCGTLRGGLPLIDFLEAGHYWGLDSRAEVLDEARRELQEAGLAHKSPTLLVSPDLAQMELDQRFDVIWAYAVLIHMTDEIVDGCLALVSKHLADGGVFFANVCLGERSQALLKWQGFPVVWRDLSFYQQLAARHSLDVTDLGTLASLGDVSNLQSIDQQHMLRFAPN